MSREFSIAAGDQVQRRATLRLQCRHPEHLGQLGHANTGHQRGGALALALPEQLRVVVLKVGRQQGDERVRFARTGRRCV